MSWFAKWFSSPYYKLLYRNRNEEEAQFFINNILKVIHLNSGSKIIDVGCGYGRHAALLADYGFDVVGIDFSPEKIEAASEQTLEHLRFYEHDMRLPYPETGFHLALNLFTSFGYFDDVQENVTTLTEINHSLLPGGYLVIDFFNAQKVENELVKDEELVVDDIRFHIRRSIKAGYVIKDIKVKDAGETHLYYEKVQLLTRENFLSYLKQTGFILTHEFGNYKLDAFQVQTSDRYILIAKKPAN